MRIASVEGERFTVEVIARLTGMDRRELLEALYVEQVDVIAARLARHFEAAGHTCKAIGYLWRAGERAMRLFAYEEAIDSLHRGLALCISLPESPKNVQ